MWEQKQLRGSPFSSRRSSVSSPFSHHQLRDLHVISSASPLDSPSEGYRLPQWTPLSNDASMDDFIAAAAEPSARTSALTSTSEQACTLTGVSDSLSASSQRLTKGTPIVAANRPSHLYRSFSRHCLSKLGSRRLFAREKLDGIARFGSAGRRNLLSENGQGSGHQTEDDGNQPTTLSQLVASSTREVFGWSDVNSVSHRSWNADEDGLRTCMPLPFERIRADMSQPDEDSGALDFDVLEKCSSCSRALSHRSPWSLQTYGGSNDLPVVGVLVCGHAFHADCLEKSASDTSNSNPPCPQCMQVENISLKAFALRLDRVKHTIKPLKRQLTRLLRAKSVNSVSKSNEDVPGLPRSFTLRRKGLFSRSLSKLQAPLLLQVKATKDSGPHNPVSD